MQRKAVKEYAWFERVAKQKQIDNAKRPFTMRNPCRVTWECYT